MSSPDSIKIILSELSQEIEAHRWREYFSKLSSNYETDYERKCTEDRFKYMRGLESLNGGMGSLNDATHTKEVKEKIHSLYQRVYQELISLWSELGNETYDLKTIKPYKVGTAVKLVVGKALYIKPDGSIKYVPNQKWTRDQEWKIEYIANPDITNMLQYSLIQGAKHILVRHDALTPTKRGLFANVRQLLTKQVHY